MGPSDAKVGLAGFDAFADLGPDDRASLEARLRQLHVARSEVLVRQGEMADALYIVVSGRFEVTVAGRKAPIAEIGAGQPIGEIAFLAGGVRTATVRALRDSLVLKLDRSDFEDLSAKNPSVWRSLTVSLARRLAESNLGRRRPPDPKPRTLVLVRAGPSPIPERFLEMLGQALAVRTNCIVVDARRVRDLIGGTDFTGSEATQTLNALEVAHDHVLYIADDELTPWSEKAIRQADLVLAVGIHDVVWSGRVALNPLERFVREIHSPDGQRLVLLHARRGPISGTTHWLADRRVAMHHHVAIDSTSDTERLCRFIDGSALGLVACGGGAYCSAHVGLFKAFAEAGVTFDILGGTSGGSAMAAAFAMGSDPDTIDDATHDIFVTHKAMRRYTWPRYGLLDHAHYDEQLRKHFGGTAIEDLWLPYFAVSTNLSTHGLEQHRQGEVWLAVRASGSIPGLLPPYFTRDGQMLVDGALLDNVPIAVMHDLKSGPNVVVSFELPRQERFGIEYMSLPSRRELLRSFWNPFARELPDAPGPGSVLLRSMMASRQDFERHLGDDDLLLVPPFPPSMGILDWHRHRELKDLAHSWGRAEIERQVGLGHPVFNRKTIPSAK